MAKRRKQIRTEFGTLGTTTFPLPDDVRDLVKDYDTIAEVIKDSWFEWHGTGAKHEVPAS